MTAYCRPCSSMHWVSMDQPDRWTCSRCGGSVMCWEGTTEPVGDIADWATMAAREEARRLLGIMVDKRQRASGVARRLIMLDALKWLSRSTGIYPVDMHIGLLNFAEAKRAISAMKRYVQ